eukprot:5544581-Pyramimonas_sp.AAC.1
MCIRDSGEGGQGGTAADGVGAEPGGPAPGPWQKENALHRRLGMKFINGDPFARLVLMRLCVEPLRLLLADKFALAAD